MGTTAHVVVVVDDDRVAAEAMLDRAVGRLEELERRWSRFLPDSEISRCNAADGAPVTVSTDTRLLVARSIAGWEATAGRFDPTVLPALVAAGYDAPFDVVRARATTPAAHTNPVAAPGCTDIVVDDRAGTVTLPRGVAFDPGGIGKGLAADLVAAETMAAGARGVCVNLGGDLRLAGDGPDGEGWIVELEHPLTDERLVTDERLATVHLTTGAIASTWRTKRAWGDPDDRRHHVIDPDEGAPAWSGLAGVVVLTGAGWWAEVLATAAFLSGRDARALLEAHDAAGLLVADDGTVKGAGPIEEFRR
jgi:thiamine biosynthesis lipoprotein